MYSSNHKELEVNLKFCDFCYTLDMKQFFSGSKSRILAEFAVTWICKRPKIYLYCYKNTQFGSEKTVLFLPSNVANFCVFLHISFVLLVLLFMFSILTSLLAMSNPNKHSFQLFSVFPSNAFVSTLLSALIIICRLKAVHFNFNMLLYF